MCIRHNIKLKQGWAIGCPRAKCGLLGCFQWPTEAFRNNLQT